MTRIGAITAKLKWGTALAGGAVALALIMAPASGVTAAVQDKPVKLEAVAGTNLKRVTLTAKAAERLGIMTAAVREEKVARKQMVGGEIVDGPSLTPVASKSPGGLFMMPVAAAPSVAAAPPAALAMDSGAIWVLVPMAESELSRVATDQPVRVMPLGARKWAGVTAQPSKMPPVADPGKASIAMYYVVRGDAKGLTKGQRVRVELPLAESGPPRKSVPYAAVFYDTKGQSWLYTNPAPLTFVRHKIGVESIEGDVAILSEGPANGTPVVTVGAMLLYGAETN